FGLLAARHFARILGVPRHYLLPAVAVLSVIGTFAIRNSGFDVGVMLLFGVVGFLFSRAGIPKAPLVLALILGPILEENLRRMLQLHRGDAASAFADLVTSPVGMPIFIAACA